MPAADPTTTSRVRALLGLRGGPLVEVEEAIMPVALVAGWPTLRQPQLETPDLIARRFLITVEEVVAVGGNHARVGIRSGDVRALLWLTRMWAYSRDAGGQVEAKWGRADTWAHGGNWVAGYQDFRLPDSNLWPSPIDAGTAETNTFATFHGNAQGMIDGGTTSAVVHAPILLDEVLVTDGVAPDEFTVELITVDRDLIVTFEGYVFDLGR